MQKKDFKRLLRKHLDSMAVSIMYVEDYFKYMEKDIERLRELATGLNNVRSN